MKMRRKNRRGIFIKAYGKFNVGISTDAYDLLDSDYVAVYTNTEGVLCLQPVVVPKGSRITQIINRNTKGSRRISFQDLALSMPEGRVAGVWNDPEERLEFNLAAKLQD